MTATHAVGTYGNAVGTVTPLDHKMAQLGLIVKTAANTIRAGVFWDGNATIVSGKANMSYDVRALTAVLSRGATSGAVLLSNDGVFNVVTTAAPGSNSRYDVVYLWQREFSLDGTDSNPVIGVVQGTPAASPTVPSLTAFPGAIALAQILIPAGVTATNTGTTITQTAPFTSVAGGVVAARTTTERDAYVPASTDLTARCWVIADGITYQWTGTFWAGLISSNGAAAPIAVGTLSGTSVTVSGLAAKLALYNEIVIRIGKLTGAGDVVVQLYQSGAAIATGYNVQALYANGTTVTAGGAYGGATLWNLGAGSSTQEIVTITLRGVGKSYAKFGHVETGAGVFTFSASITNSNTSPCDGFVFTIGGGGAFTGDYAIFGTA